MTSTIIATAFDWAHFLSLLTTARGQTFQHMRIKAFDLITRTLFLGGQIWLLGLVRPQEAEIAESLLTWMHDDV